MSEERPTRAPHRPQPVTLLYLAFVVVCWGFNWPIMKFVVRDIGPLAFAALRLIGAAAAIGIMVAVRGERLWPARDERIGLGWSGILQIGFLFTLNMLGVAFVMPGRASVLCYTMPLWAILFGVWLARERPGRARLASAALGFAGLVIFFDPRLIDWHDGRALFGNGVLLLSAALWALGAVLYRLRHWQSAFWAQVFWQILCAAIPVSLLALLLEGDRPIRWSWTLVAALVYNWLFGTGLGYWCWAKVLAEVSAATAGQVVMLVPVIAFLCSALLFGEVISLQVLVSVGLILLGVVMTLRTVRPARP